MMRKQILSWLLPCLLAAATAAIPAIASTNGNGNTWDFRVFLDEKEIGTHRFDLVQNGADRTLTSKARFDVKILFVNAYSYDHHDVEHWNGDCLAKLTSRTDDNGKKHEVEVQRGEGETRVQTNGRTANLGDCVMTFAYWNPAMLTQSRLLNSQDGEYIDVKIAAAGTESIDVRGVSTPAKRYELRSKKLSIDLWYSQDNQWLALESRTERGQRLIYKLK